MAPPDHKKKGVQKKVSELLISIFLLIYGLKDRDIWSYLNLLNKL
tara:strand:+ start:289 stop:423 length:135 start_codon:yes stop_codon:yes gene_type:complete